MNSIKKLEQLQNLRERVAAFDGCELKLTAQKTVFADGNPNARVMAIGEAPGADEDAQGLPFVGRSGRLLSQLLAAAGFNRAERDGDAGVYISNMMFWRPPNNRTPTKAELKTTAPFVEEHIGIVQPDVLILVGNVPAQTLLKTKQGVTKIHGQFFEYHNAFLAKSIQAMPLYHPAYALRNPKEKATMQLDLALVKQLLDEK